MPSQQRAEQLSKEGRIGLAIASLQLNPSLSIRKLSKVYNVPRSTLQSRLHGIQPIHETRSLKRALSSVEEQSLVQWILDLASRGFPPHIIDVRRMADTLRAARGQNPPPPPLGRCWAQRFINAQPELKMRWSRKFHSQRALCEDPVTIQEWFKLVQDTRERYGILDEDTYNFDETGFQIGVASTSKVVTGSETVGRARAIQPGDREWVTVIECVCARGWAIPPFVILQGRVHQAAWYSNLPADWIVAVSDNGWTNNDLGLTWIQHFHRSTQSVTRGAYRLLILDGHDSHATPKFDLFCAQNQIITLCMPPHTSHLLQPLDLGCYSPLKHAYGNEVLQLARERIFHVDKVDFLSMYQAIRPSVFSQKNIQAGFQAASLIPYCPERVLSSLSVVRTPPQPGTPPDWVAETPHTVSQLQKQAQYIQNLLRRQSDRKSTRLNSSHSGESRMPSSA